MKNQLEFVIKSVCESANELDEIATTIQKTIHRFIYKGETQTRFAEKLRHCVLSNRYDIPDETKNQVWDYQHGKCTVFNVS